MPSALGRAVRKSWGMNPDRIRHLTFSQKKDARKIAQKQIKNALEEYIVTSNNGAASVDNTVGTIAMLSATVQGSAVNTRSGNEIKVNQLTFKCTLKTGTLATSPGMVRVIIFRDMQQNGTVITSAELLQDYAGNATDWQKMINKSSTSKMRIRVLRDKIYKVSNYVLGETAAGTFSRQPNDGSVWKNFVMKVRFKKGIKCQYKGATANQTDQGAGNIYVAFFTNQPSTANFPISIEYCSEIKFNDS